MDAREESEWYRRDYERGEFEARLDPHGEIITDEELEAWREHWKQEIVNEASNNERGGQSDAQNDA